MTKENIFNLEDLTDIPGDLRADLSFLKIDKFHKGLISILELADRPVNLDEISIAYFRLFGEGKSRRDIMIKLYNMSKSKQSAIQSVPQKRGVYTLKK
jgi:hypothetical protein